MVRSQRKLASLIGVNGDAVRKYVSRHHKNYNTTNGLDAFLVKTVTAYFAYKSRKTTSEAKDLVDRMLEAGAKAFLYHEAGYQFDARKDNQIAEQLARAQERLSYCSIDENTPKAVFKFRSNQKVNGVYKVWSGIGWLVERKRMVEQIDYLLTPEGSENLYFEGGQIKVRPERHQETRLITHGAQLALCGQSDIFTNQSL